VCRPDDGPWLSRSDVSVKRKGSKGFGNAACRINPVMTVERRCWKWRKWQNKYGNYPAPPPKRSERIYRKALVTVQAHQSSVPESYRPCFSRTMWDGIEDNHLIAWVALNGVEHSSTPPIASPDSKAGQGFADAPPKRDFEMRDLNGLLTFVGNGVRKSIWIWTIQSL